MDEVSQEALNELVQFDLNGVVWAGAERRATMAAAPRPILTFIDTEKALKYIDATLPYVTYHLLPDITGCADDFGFTHVTYYGFRQSIRPYGPSRHTGQPNS